ncbi:MAG: asparagine synthase (glutamine-hydrolyzing) [Bacteroidetes bacterium HGW-Bacteroidetes-6]|jgi:asparagine synthase (glutamine-hydrolysing)|nr:MAG: asparagine synthase (glutamine-hydrolyzing) [Bacteroidetes bacterium HGW-Bacteroidetes-6]
MCGITGVFAKTDNGRKYFSMLPAALAKLGQRGPDFAGTAEGNRFCFGHARLSIIDVSDASNQPFNSADKRYTMVFNGEIFNFREIRTNLEQRGVVFQTSGDTEVVLQAFIHFGTECFAKFNGFFAIAVFDALENKLILARDRYGIKPLLYFADDSALVFASEMKAIMRFGLPKELDETSVYEYFRLTYIPEPYTVFSNIHKLEPAHFAIISTDNFELSSYYHISNRSFDGSYSQACEHLRELLSDSVKLRLISDVPLGSFLSGGIDSSVVSALAAQHNPGIHAYSIGFPDTPYYDESEFAAEVARMHGLQHTIIPVSEKDFAEAIPGVLEYLDEPFADSSAIAVNVLSSFVKKHVTVALSGDGADEIFGGYRKHRALAMINEASAIKRFALSTASIVPDIFGRGSVLSDKLRQARRLGLLARTTPHDRYLFLAAFHSEKEISQLLENGNSADFSRLENQLLLNRPDEMNDVLRNDVKLVLAGDMLRKVDLMSMAASLEVRSPFLDFRVIDFAFSLQSKHKFDGLATKKILTDTFRSMLPERILNRPKHGFEVPVAKWMNSILLKQMKELWFDDSFVRRQGIFNSAAMRRLLNEVENGKAMRRQSLLWSVIVFQNWWINNMGE